MLKGKLWDASKFDLTKTIVGMTALIGADFLFDIEVAATKELRANLIVSPADLIVKREDAYEDEDAAKKIRALHDFLAQIISERRAPNKETLEFCPNSGFIAYDQRSSCSYAEIEAAVRRIMKLERGLAQIIMNEGPNEEMEFVDAIDKSDFAKLAKIASIVSADAYYRLSRRIV